MLFRQIILHIFDQLQHDRTISSAFHLLQGKKSGQTLQDVGMYKLFPYFSLLKKLTKQTFDQEVAAMQRDGYLIVDEAGYYMLTEQAQLQPLPYYNGWQYRGREHVFFARLSLIVQALSHQKHNVRAFIPIQRNEEVQQWCRHFLVEHRYTTNLLQQPLYEELSNVMEATGAEDVYKEIVMARLHGYEVAGVTWQQLAYQYHMTELDCQLMFVSMLHRMLDEILTERYPLLFNMAQSIVSEQYVTDSANETAKLYFGGHTLEQIALLRRLKQSTIEDHFVELAMYHPAMSIDSFVTHEEQRQVWEMSEAYATKKLKVLKEALPHLTYFQLKLALAKGGAV